jgi:threonine synthase
MPGDHLSDWRWYRIGWDVEGDPGNFCTRLVRLSCHPKICCRTAGWLRAFGQAFENGDSESQTWSDPQTIASGLRSEELADRLILRIVRESQGTAITVSEKEILDAQHNLATKEGIFAAPEGAATLAGLIRLHDIGWIKSDERIVIFNTGSG